MKQDRGTMSVEQAADWLGIGRNSAYEAVKTGDIPSIRIGKRILVPIAALERKLLLASDQPPESQGAV